MSWDIWVRASEVPPPRVADMPDDWESRPLGSVEEMRSRISTSIPAVDWSDPHSGIYVSETLSFKFNIGKNETCTGFMVHVRGGGNAVEPLVELADRWKWYLLDCSQGEWLHHCENDAAGWHGFQEYRDRVLREMPATDGNP